MEPAVQKTFGSLAISDALFVQHLEVARYSRCSGQLARAFLRRLGRHPDLVMIVLECSIEQDVDISFGHAPIPKRGRWEFMNCRSQDQWLRKGAQAARLVLP